MRHNSPIHNQTVEMNLKREYNSLEQKDANTLYFITENESSKLGMSTFPLVFGERESSKLDEDAFPLILD